MSTKDNPRDAALETKFTLPKTWYQEDSGLLNYLALPTLQFTDLCFAFNFLG